MYMSLAAGVYCRISEDKEGAGLGVERQRRDCERLADQRTWKVIDVYVDNDISAYSGKPRPAYRRLLADIESGRVEAIVVWHLDRLHRQPRELETFIDLVERHAIALASVSGEHDLSTPEGRLHARILGAVARMESEHKSRRIRRKMADLAALGRPHGGGFRAFGYQRDGLTVDAGQATVILEVAERILAGETLRNICMDLNARGIGTTTGGPWIPRSLKRVMTGSRIAGLREHHAVGTVHAAWPAIIGEDVHTRLLAVLNDPRRRSVGAPRLLSDAEIRDGGDRECQHGGPLRRNDRRLPLQRRDG